MQLVTIDQNKLKEIIQSKPYFKTFEIPAGTYGNDAAIPTAAIMNALLVSSDLSEADGYKLTKASDVEAGQNAGLAQTIRLLEKGKTREDSKADVVICDVRELLKSRWFLCVILFPCGIL